METKKKEDIIKEGNFDKMKEYIISLETSIKGRDAEIANLNQTVISLKKEKISLLTTVEQKDATIQEMSSMISSMTSKQNLSDSKYKELSKQNETLNHSIIELTQKNKTLTENAKFYENSNNNLRDYIMQIAKLSNKLDELEISKAKSEFDKSNLIHTINDLKSNNETEMKLLTYYKNNEIAQYQKTIASLQSTINELNNVNVISYEEGQNTNTHSNILLEQIAQLENQLSKINEENFSLQKENQNLKSDNDEKEIQLTHKDTVIASLQKEIDASIEEYKAKLNEAQLTSDENFYQSKETQSQLEQLILERDELIRKNEELKKEYEQFNNSINEASAAFSEKCEKFEKAVNEYKAKNKEYKTKIKNLKSKINELYKEIDSLKKENQDAYSIIESNHLKIKTDNEMIHPNNIPSSIVNPNIDFRRGSGLQSYNNSYVNTANDIHSIYKKENVYSSLSSSPSPSYTGSYLVMKDPLEDSQKKSIDEFRKVLTKVDLSLQQIMNKKY